ncbi:MAG: 1-deoxy-D-xylulose 5-phosphate reductoisomerase [Bryobacterales bacterium]|nr:1-deoxy-D-xylulose 5-phosphate reductoisomerase [Bryobacterales bacterium]
MIHRTLTVLGSTGSIGANTLDVVRQNPELFTIFALAAGRNVALLAQQILEFKPAVVVLPDEAGRATLSQILPKTEVPELLVGPESLVRISIAPESDTLMSSIVGVAGLEATHAAACHGKRIGLANKESLVSAGKLMMAAVAQNKAELIPVDSEHNGAHQCLRAGRRREATKLILTASGGPFRNTPASDLDRVTPADALKHPTWKMGNRITIDSATLMNKGFEVIEAHWLFGFSPDEIEVVVHPQSSVHAMVEFEDGSVIAQISATDMRMPIQYALTWPDRASAPVPKIDWSQTRAWDFHAPDLDRFPLLRLAYDTLRAGGAASCILNAADEIAVEAFLAEKIGFTGIARVVRETLEKMPHAEPQSIAEVLSVDLEARRVARDIVAENAILVGAKG